MFNSEEDKKAMEQAMKEWIEAENKQTEIDMKFLESIKKQVSVEMFRLIGEEIIESEHAENFRIVDFHEGESTGTTDIKVWVDQHSYGDSGDSWVGIVYIELPDGKYLAWDYSM